MRWNSLNGVPRGSKNGSGAIIRMRTVPVIFARNDSTVSHPFRRMSQDQPQSSAARRYLMLAVKFSVSIILLVVLFTRIDVAELWQTARLASVPWLLVAILVYAVSTTGAVWRWHLLLKAQRIDVTFLSALGTLPGRDLLQQFSAKQYRR